jgi:hypothetical protein
MQPLDPAAIRQSFVNCSRGLAKLVALPPDFTRLDWDELDFLGWNDPKVPSRSYIVGPHADRTIGILLRAGDSSTRRSGTALCALCSSTRPANDVLLFAAPRAGAAGRAGNTIGTYICADLNCSLYVRGKLKLPTSPAERLPPAERAELLRERLDAFVGRVLDE